MTRCFRYIFLAIYTAEMIIKSIAKGFILNKYTYLRNPWNWLDFVVITSGYATIGMDVGNLAGLRTFRVLRALKTVSIMPGTIRLTVCVESTRVEIQQLLRHDVASHSYGYVLVVIAARLLHKVTVSRTEDILFSSKNAKPKKKLHFENFGVSILGTSILLSGSSFLQNGRNSMNISMKIFARRSKNCTAMQISLTESVDNRFLSFCLLALH